MEKKKKTLNKECVLHSQQDEHRKKTVFIENSSKYQFDKFVFQKLVK